MPTEGNDLPSQFGRYLLVARLAIGGMAEVFRAKISAAHGFEKILVIKRILPHLAADKNFVSMFIDEAKLTAQLTHPKIVQVTDFGEVAGQYFIALEFIDGFDALALLRASAHRRIRLPVHLCVFIAQEMLDALDYAHNAVDAEGRPMKLVHRDISPSNVFISRRGDVKLGDFGIAHAQERESKTQAGTLKGKYGYMSPEQVTGNPLDGRSDAFAVGIVLAEMLMGRRLFTAPNDLDVLLMVRDGRLERLDKYCRDVPAELEAIVRKGLAKSAAERYQSASAFRDALSDWLFRVGKRVAAADLAAFTRDLFDESPEALARLQEQQAKAKAKAEAEVVGRGASPAGAPTARTPVPAAPPSITPPPALIETLAPAPSRVGPPPTPRPAPPARSVPPTTASARGPARGRPPHGSDELLAEEEASAPIQLDVDDLQPMSTHAPAPDPRIAAAFDSALGHALSIVDIDQWGGDSGVGPALGPGLDPRDGLAGPGPAHGPSAQRRSDLGRFVSGAPRRPPDSAGDLSVISPMRILADMAASAESGLLHFEVGLKVKEVHLAGGAPQFVNSSTASERFGEFLVAQRIISPTDLDNALASLPRFSGKLGDTLVGLRLMKPLDVFRLLSQQVRERVMEVFSWTEGAFAYYRGVANPHDGFPLSLDAFEILGAGLLALAPSVIERRLEAMLDFRPRAASRLRIPPEKFRLGPTPREVLMLLDGSRTVRQWLAHFSAPDERTTFLRTLYILIETDLAQVE